MMAFKLVAFSEWHQKALWLEWHTKEWHKAEAEKRAQKNASQNNYTLEHHSARRHSAKSRCDHLVWPNYLGMFLEHKWSSTCNEKREQHSYEKSDQNLFLLRFRNPIKNQIWHFLLQFRKMTSQNDDTLEHHSARRHSAKNCSGCLVWPNYLGMFLEHKWSSTCNEKREQHSYKKSDQNHFSLVSETLLRIRFDIFFFSSEKWQVRMTTPWSIILLDVIWLKAIATIWYDPTT
jgi:hypothetical protein